jgi:hypothetical protein
LKLDILYSDFHAYLGLIRFFSFSGAKSTGKPSRWATSQALTVAREIIWELVKIACLYCGNLYEEKEDKCHHLAARIPRLSSKQHYGL